MNTIDKLIADFLDLEQSGARADIGLLDFVCSVHNGRTAGTEAA